MTDTRSQVTTTSRNTRVDALSEFVLLVCWSGRWRLAQTGGSAAWCVQSTRHGRITIAEAPYCQHKSFLESVDSCRHSWSGAERYGQDVVRSRTIRPLGSKAESWICAAPAAELYSRCDQRQLDTIIAYQCTLARLVTLEVDWSF